MSAVSVPKHGKARAIIHSAAQCHQMIVSYFEMGEIRRCRTRVDECIQNLQLLNVALGMLLGGNDDTENARGNSRACS